jgi:DinB superfamily
MNGFILLLVSAVMLGSQPIPAGMKVGLSMYLQAGYGGLKSELSEAADMMPESDYEFRPGAAPEMRTFGQLFAHVAESQFGTCAAIRAVPNPVAGKNLERDLKTKSEFVKALADSFAFCDVAFSALTDANALEYVKVGQGEVVKSAVLTGILAHNSEMYGIATVYLRAKNLVPPSTKRQTQGR